MSQPILITGAAGFIGNHLVRGLAAQFPNMQIIGVGRRAQRPATTRPANYAYIPCDILQPKTMERRLPSKISALFHLAGDPRTGLPPEERSQQTLANVWGASCVADYAKRAQAELFLFASSVYAYSGSTIFPFQEETPGMPVENLGASKLGAESLLKARAVTGDFKAVAFRIFTVYGPGCRPNQFIPEAIRKLRSEVQVVPFGHPGVRRDFIHVSDVARALMLGLSYKNRKSSWDVFNVGSGRSASIKDIVFTLADLMGTRKKITFKTGKRGMAQKDHQADLSHTKTTLRWKPSISLRAGLQQMLETGESWKPF